MLVAQPLLAADPVPPAGTEQPPAGAPSATPAVDPEQQISEQLRAGPAGADAVDLTVDSNTVLALWHEQQRAQAEGAVILLHDVGAHADWPGVISPLRRQLPGYGWSTLSVELPAPPAGTTPVDYGPLLEPAQKRIKAALDFLKGKNIRNVVLLGHGLGAFDALRFAADTPDPALTGLVLLGLGDYKTSTPPQDSTELLNKLNIPIYDLYGSDDGSDVIHAAALRAQVGSRLNGQRPGMRTAEGVLLPFYRQAAIAGVGHSFDDQSSLLVRRIYGWLKTHAAGMEVKIKK